MPFAGATIGKDFRNELLLDQDCWEFMNLLKLKLNTNPNKKKHPKYKHVKDLKWKLSRKRQIDKNGIIEMTIDEALYKNIW